MVVTIKVAKVGDVPIASGCSSIFARQPSFIFNGLRSKRVLLDELKLCSSTKDLQRGKTIHYEVMVSGYASCIYLATSLVKMYAKCGSMLESRQVFDSIKHRDVVSWTTLIMGYAENGNGLTALYLFAKMASQGYEPDSFILVATLKACSSLAGVENGKSECLEWGKQIHSAVGCHLNIHVQNTLIDMYAKCGSMIEARQVFNGMRGRDVVSWNALMLGYAENGEGITALDLFESMKFQGCVPDTVSFVAALKACGPLGSLESGRKIHAEIGTEIEGEAMLVTCLVDFYAKCGSLVEAQKVFDMHPRERDMKTWTALLAGYSRLGYEKAVFELLDAMQDAGFLPNGITFLCILSCCSHSGLIERANEFFHAMSLKYGITPTIQHYNCMVDILGRLNKLDDAISLLQSMPCRPNAVTWMTILGACHKWKNVKIGRLAFKSLVNINLDDTTTTAYVLMANIYGSTNMWKEQEMVLAMSK